VMEVRAEVRIALFDTNRGEVEMVRSSMFWIGSTLRHFNLEIIEVPIPGHYSDLDLSLPLVK